MLVYTQIINDWIKKKAKAEDSAAIYKKSNSIVHALIVLGLQLHVKLVKRIVDSFLLANLDVRFFKYRFHRVVLEVVQVLLCNLLELFQILQFESTLLSRDFVKCDKVVE